MVLFGLFCGEELQGDKKSSTCYNPSHPEDPHPLFSHLSLLVSQQEAKIIRTEKDFRNGGNGAALQRQQGSVTIVYADSKWDNATVLLGLGSLRTLRP